MLVILAERIVYASVYTELRTNYTVQYYKLLYNMYGGANVLAVHQV